MSSSRCELESSGQQNADSGTRGSKLSKSNFPSKDENDESLNSGKNSDIVPTGKRVLEDLSLPAGKRARRSLPHSHASSCTTRRRYSERPSLRRGSKNQKQSSKVQSLLQEHGNATVCVC